jgi:hypothetical protein
LYTSYGGNVAGESHHDRERLERLLLDEVRTSERAYQAARSQHDTIREEFRDMVDGMDGSYALDHATAHERTALENYRRALKAFTGLVVFHRAPAEPKPE